MKKKEVLNIIKQVSKDWDNASSDEIKGAKRMIFELYYSNLLISDNPVPSIEQNGRETAKVQPKSLSFEFFKQHEKLIINDPELELSDEGEVKEILYHNVVGFLEDWIKQDV